VYCLQVQFVIVFIHEFQLLIFECDYPKSIVIMQLSYSMYFMYMFGAFYTKTYLSKKKAWNINILIHMCVYFMLWICVCVCMCVFVPARVDLRKNNRR